MKTIKDLIHISVIRRASFSETKGELYTLKQSSTTRILRRLSRGNAFYFFTSVGNYTGHKATSLEEFATKISEVEIESLEFHLYRGDLEKWSDEVLEDHELTKRLGTVKLLEPVGNALRDQLDFVISKRFEELKAKQ